MKRRVSAARALRSPHRSPQVPQVPHLRGAPRLDQRRPAGHRHESSKETRHREEEDSAHQAHEYARWKREQILASHVTLPRFPREDSQVNNTVTAQRGVSVKDEMKRLTEGLDKMDKENLYRLKHSTEAWVKNQNLAVWMPRNPTKSHQQMGQGELTKAAVMKSLLSSGQFSQEDIDALNEAGSFERVGLVPARDDDQSSQLSQVWKETCGGSHAGGYTGGGWADPASGLNSASGLNTPRRSPRTPR